MPFNESLYTRYSYHTNSNEGKEEGNDGYEKKLRFGYYIDDGYFEPFSGCQRAVREAKEALEKAGFEVVPFPIEEMVIWDNGMKVLLGLYTANHHQNFFEDLKNSEVDPALVSIPCFCKTLLPSSLHKLTLSALIAITGARISGTRISHENSREAAEKGHQRRTSC